VGSLTVPDSRGVASAVAEVFVRLWLFGADGPESHPVRPAVMTSADNTMMQR
jgi:hypothetical protein